MNQKIKTVVFVSSFTGPEAIKRLDPLPTVAIIGRSNVGKSTFINSILGSRKIAKTGKTPGKTKLINYFLVNDRFYVVDLPGYGYAKLSKTERRGLLSMINRYLRVEPRLKLITQLFDIRIGATKQDEDYFNMMYRSEIPLLLIANKADKLSKNQVQPALKKISEQLNIDVSPTPYSSVKQGQADPIVAMVAKQLGVNNP